MSSLAFDASAAPLLSDADQSRSARSIVAEQLPSGLVPRFRDGNADPWNHVEALMALSSTGFVGDAERGYRWLRQAQDRSGAWAAYYTADGIEDPRHDTNVCAYVAAGTWHHYLTTGDRSFLEGMWPVVERAIDFVLRFQEPGGEVLWIVDTDGTPGTYALLTASSSIYQSLRCAVAVAEEMGADRPDWELAAGRLRHALAHREECFEPKERYSMDWYYPVLAGALTGAAASKRLDSGWDEFVIGGRGVRCVRDKDWVTTAETAECAIACAAAGRPDDARTLLTWIAEQRREDGSYLTGTVYPQGDSFPRHQRTTYSAAAMVLATRAVSPVRAADTMLLGTDLPCGFDIEPDAIGDPA